MNLTHSEKVYYIYNTNKKCHFTLREFQKSENKVLPGFLENIMQLKNPLLFFFFFPLQARDQLGLDWSAN